MTGDLGRFAAVGAGGYVVNLLVFVLLERSLRAGHTASATGAFAVAVTNNYVWNRCWTFQTRAGRVPGQALRFLAVSSVGLLGNLAILHLLLAFSAPALAAQAVGVVVAMPLTFLGNRLWSFPETLGDVAAAEAAIIPARLPVSPRAVVCLTANGDAEELRQAVGATAAVLGERDVVVVVEPQASSVAAGGLAGEDRVAVVYGLPSADPDYARLAGLRYASLLGPELVVDVAGSLALAPVEVSRAVEAAAEADLVVGAREAPHGAGRPTRIVALGSRLTAALLRLPVRDLGAGLVCYRRSALAHVDLDRVTGRRSAALAEVAFRCTRAGATVVELPVAPAGDAAAWTRGSVFEVALRMAELRLAAAGESLRRYAWIVKWWALSRVLVLGPALVVQLISWPRPSWYPSVLDRPFALLGAWDGRWYRMVAERGYLVIPHHQSDTAFFPLFPVAMRGLHALGLSLTTGGMVLANVGFLVGLVALYELARTWLEEEDARRAVVYAALFPAGFVFSMVYPEGLVLGVVALAGLLAVRGRWIGAGLLAALAALSRPEGVFLALPFLALAARQWGSLSERGRVVALWGVLAAPTALAALCLYDLRIAHDPLAFSHAQLAWGRWTSANGVVRAVHELIEAPALGRQWLYRDAIFCALYAACLVLALRARVPASWVAAGALIVFLPLWSGSFTSDARFGLLALPVYCGLAYLARRPRLDVFLRATSACVLAASSATILLHWP